MRLDFRGIELRALMRAEDEGRGEADDRQLERDRNCKLASEPLFWRAQACGMSCHEGAILRLLRSQEAWSLTRGTSKHL